MKSFGPLFEYQPLFHINFTIPLKWFLSENYLMLLAFRNFRRSFSYKKRYSYIFDALSLKFDFSITFIFDINFKMFPSAVPEKKGLDRHIDRQGSFFSIKSADCHQNFKMSES